MTGRPHFFCENCGTEVSRKAAKCPGCGRYFSSVRCPKCDFVGAEQLFAEGCPVCGYSSTGTHPEQGPKIEAEQPRRNRHPSAESAGALPIWVYAVTALAVVAVAAAAILVLN